MFKIITCTLFLLIATPVFAADFVHPLDFKGTNDEKQKVVAYIKENVKETYSKIGMDNPSTLRMMEQKELDSFKQLTKAENRKLLDKVITTYCNIGMCNYNTFLMMYNKELSESKKSLKW